MNAYEASVQFNLVGTDQEILNQMSAMTDNNIRRDDLVLWLQDNGYWEETPLGMIGDLVAGYNASTGALRKKFDRVWRWLYKRLDSDVLRTSQPVQADDVLAVINRITTISASVRNQYFALGGGAPYRQTTTVEFAAQRTVYQAEAAAAAAAADLESDWINAQNQHINANVYDRAALVAGLRAAATQIEAG
jgi:hypothetical protein